jgi:hypothetical protein
MSIRETGGRRREDLRIAPQGQEEDCQRLSIES